MAVPQFDERKAFLTEALIMIPESLGPRPTTDASTLGQTKRSPARARSSRRPAALRDVFELELFVVTVVHAADVFRNCSKFKFTWSVAGQLDPIESPGLRRTDMCSSGSMPSGTSDGQSLRILTR